MAIEITRAAKRVAAQTPRAEQVQQERRRRKEFGLRSRLRLSVPDEYRDDANYVYRWIVDSPGRINQLTNSDDYDFVVQEEIANDERNTSTGTRIERHAGTDREGKPLRAYLVRKRREHYEHDKRAEQTEISERMAAIKRGRTPDERGEAIPADGMYTPRGGIVIQENNT